MPSTHSVVMVALLPIPIKIRNIPQTRLDDQWQTTPVVLKEVFWRVLQPLTFKQHPSAGSGYYNFLCADGNFSHCKLVVAATLAECPEYRQRHHLERHVYLRCECPKNKLGDHIPPDAQHPRRDHNLCTTLTYPEPKAADADRSSCHVHREFNVFRHIPCIVSDLPMPNLLHTMQIGMLDHLR